MGRGSILVFVIAVLLAPAGLFAQEKTAEKSESGPKKPAYMSPSARLASAKTAVVQNAGGSDVPYNVIASGVEGWGRFQLVDSRSKADIIIEVTSPEEDKKSGKMGGHVSASGRTADAPAPSAGLGEDVRLAVYDARTHIALWSATERPKGGFRQRAREGHLIEAAERLLARFRERLEPPAQAPSNSSAPPKN